MTGLLVVDDDELMRAGMSAILASDPGLEVVAEAASGHEALEVVRSARPAVALLDIRLPDVSGLEVARALADEAPDCAIVLVTALDDDEQVRVALEGGYSFVLKSSSPAELIEAVRIAASGGAYIAPRITARLLARAAPQVRADPRLEALSARERDVLLLLAAGESNDGIARSLHVSEGTVKVHVTAILRKLGVDNRVKAAVIAHQSGIVP